MEILRIIAATTFTLMLLIPAGQAAEESTKPDVVEMRKIIEEGNAVWGKARVAVDTAVFERMLAPDFYVQLPGHKLTRQEFLHGISSAPAGVTLTRFDPTVLTVQADGDAWVATILEKMEYERKAADGKVEKVFALWVTRDG